MEAENGLSTASRRRPRVSVLRSPRRSAPAPWFGLKLRADTARSTRSRIWGDTFASSLITRETVLMPTPARAATSRMVARGLAVSIREAVTDIDVSLPGVQRIDITEFVISQGLTR